MADKSLINRALDESDKDIALIEAAKVENDVAALHQICHRLVEERRKLAQGFAAMVEGWAMLKQDLPKANEQPAIDAIERVATEAIAFAREVIQMVTSKRDNV